MAYILDLLLLGGLEYLGLLDLPQHAGVHEFLLLLGLFQAELGDDVPEFLEGPVVEIDVLACMRAALPSPFTVPMNSMKFSASMPASITSVRSSACFDYKLSIQFAIYTRSARATHTPHAFETAITRISCSVRRS